MTFTSEIQKSSSERSVLIRLAPSRYMNPYLTDEGFGVWTAPFTGELFKVQVDDGSGTITLTENDTGDIDTWSYDGATLTINSFDISSTGLVSAFHYLTYTDSMDLELPIDPLGSGDSVIWEGRIKNNPKITESISNVLQGVMSVLSSSVSLENSDSALSKLFSPDDSFVNKNVGVWFNVNNQVTKQFSGKIRTIDFTGTTVVLGMVDQFSALSEPSYTGSDESLAVYGTPEYVVHPQDRNKPVPMIIGRSFGTESDSSQLSKEDAANNDRSAVLQSDHSSRPRAICTNYTGLTNASKTNNREWTLCRTLSGQSVENIDFGTTGSIFRIGDNTSVITSRVTGNSVEDVFVNTTGHNCEVGDVGIFDADFGGGPALISFVVYEVGGSYFKATTGLGGLVGNDSRADNAFPFYSVPTLAPAVSVKVAYGDSTYATLIGSRVSGSHSGGSDFYYTHTLQSDGTKKLSIILKDGFENDGSGNTQGMSPELIEMSFSVRLDPPVEHADLVEAVVASTGFTINSASITAANSDLAGTACIMTIPKNGEDEFPSVRSTLEEIMVSTLGYLTVDHSGEVSYGLFDVTGTPVGIRTDDDILSSTLIPRTNYYDMYKKLNLSSIYVSTTAVSGLPTVIQFPKATRIHGETKVKNIQTMLNFAPASLQDRYKRFIGNATHTYAYRSSSIDLELKLGDTITLQTEDLLGEVQSVDVLVIKITKSTNDVAVTGLQIL